MKLIKTLFAFVLSFAGLLAPAHGAGQSNLERAGSILQVVIPATAYGMALYRDDDEGRDQFHKSFAVNIGSTTVLKNAFDATRPNGGGKSFPSGHTSRAFQGAAFIHARYGMQYAWPAYAGAVLVAYSRVATDHHHSRDVLAGALVGVASSFSLTSGQFGVRSSFTPYVDGRSVGVVWSMELK